MKKTIGWIFLIIGILATIGGLTSTIESEPGVEILGYVFKIALIFGGILLIASKGNNTSNDAPNISISRKPIYDITKMQGYSELPEEIQKMNKLEYHSVLRVKIEDPEVNLLFSMLVNKFVIPDNISFLKYFLNDTYYKKDYSEENKKLATPTLKFFCDSIGLKALGYPSWFYCLYPDVAKWYISGPGNNILKKDFADKLTNLSSSEADVIEEFMNNELYNTENMSNKIKPEVLRELVDIYKTYNPYIKLECECD